MDREMITVYCGAGKGKTAAALGQGLMAANSGKSVIVIQFLKGCQGENLELVQRLEPEMKVFRFEKFSANYNDLGVQEQAEESANIKNAFGFAKTERFFTYKTYKRISIAALGFYALSKSYSFYTGANHLESFIPKGTPGAILSSGLILPLNICVGMVVACTMYGFYAVFRKGGM